jgi:hypothetical protein
MYSYLSFVRLGVLWEAKMLKLVDVSKEYFATILTAEVASPTRLHSVTSQKTYTYTYN